jgi:Spy/CpxP family protein refolding chaperone
MNLFVGRLTASGFVAMLFLSLLLATSARAFGQTPAAGTQGAAAKPSNPPGAVPNDPFAPLNLTKDQRQTIQAIRRQFGPAQRQAQERVQAAQDALDDAIYSDNPDEALVQQKARELSEARSNALSIRSRTELSIRRVLSVEQLSTLREIQRAARERRAAEAKAREDAARDARAKAEALRRQQQLKNQQQPHPGGKPRPPGAGVETLVPHTNQKP